MFHELPKYIYIRHINMSYLTNFEQFIAFEHFLRENVENETIGAGFATFLPVFQLERQILND